MAEAKESSQAEETSTPEPEAESESTAIAEAMNKAQDAPKNVVDLPRIRKIAEADFQPTEQVQGMYTAYPPIGTTPEDVQNPIFWAHVAPKMKAMTEIRVMPKDGTWYGIYLCLYADQHQATVKELQLFPIDVQSETDAEKYFVKWISPPLKWGIIRKDDNERIKDGFDTKKQAVIWMSGHIKAHG